MIGKGIQTKITIFVNNAGTPVTGLLAANFRVYLVKGNGVGSLYSLSGAISEPDSVNAPGIYVVTLSASILDIEGPISLTFYPVGATFDSFSYSNEVGVSASDFSLMRKILLNNQDIDSTAGTLRIYDDDGVTVIRSYYLQNGSSGKSIYDIRRKILV